MAKDLISINDSLRKIDITCLVRYSNKIRDIGSLSKMQASTYMQDFISAIDMTNLMLMNAIKLDLDAKSILSTTESIAYLDRASDYLKSKEIRDSDSAKKMYVNIDPDVVSAKDTKARTEALVAFLKNKLQVFRFCHDDVKKIGYADQQMTNFEGY